MKARILPVVTAGSLFLLILGPLITGCPGTMPDGPSGQPVLCDDGLLPPCKEPCRVISIQADSPSLSFISPNQTTQLSISGIQQEGCPTVSLTQDPLIAYASTNISVATVSATGLVTAVAAGQATISATFRTFRAEIPVTFVPVLTALDVTPPALTLSSAAARQQLTVTGIYSDGTTRDLTSPTTGTTYESADDRVAEVSAGGLIRPAASGHTTVMVRNGTVAAPIDVTIDILTTISGTSPYSGEAEVNVSRETVIDFLNPVQTIGAAAIHAVAAAQPLAVHTALSTDKKRLYVFYSQQLPGNAEVTVRVDGSQITDAAGRPIDADGDDVAGGLFEVRYTTLSLTPILGTRVMGRIFGSELLPDGMNTPLQGVRISVEGLPSVFAVTDNMGNYTLENTPAGTFFVHIDGAGEVNSQGMNGPLPYFYPTLGKPFPGVKAGQDNVMPNIYLPKVLKADLQRNIDVSQEIVITSSDPRLAGIEVRVPPNSLFREDGQPVTFVGVGAVPPDRLPGALPPGVNPPVVFTFQTDGTNLMAPASVKFPNLEHLPPGTKSALFSFNHDSGRFEFAGSMTVSSDGIFVVTDGGTGIPAPGWHFANPAGSARGGGGGSCDDKTSSSSGNVNLIPGLNPDQECGVAAVVCLSTTIGGILTCGLSPKVPLLTMPCIKIVAANGGLCSVAYCACGDCNPGPDPEPEKLPPPPPIPPIVACPTPDPANSLIVFGDTEELQLLQDLRAFIAVTNPTLLEAQALVLAILDHGGTPTDQEVTQFDALKQDLEMMSGGNIFERLRAFHPLFQLRHLGEKPKNRIRFLVTIGSEIIQRGSTGLDGAYELFLPPTNEIVTVSFFDPVGFGFGVTSIPGIAAGQSIRAFDFILDMDSRFLRDQDQDGLADVAEIIIGTNLYFVDTDLDGSPDGAEVFSGADPLGGGLAQTGIIAAIDTPGFAHEVCVKDDRAIVADGDAGISVFNVFQSQAPVLVARVDTPGTAVDVDCEGNFIAVADAGSGLAIVDISTPNAASIVHQVALPGSAQARCVSVVLGIACVGDNVGRVHLVELSSGALLGSLTLNATHSIDDLGLSNQNLFALTTANGNSTGGTLYALTLTPGLPGVAGQIGANHLNVRSGPFPRRRLSVGLGRALVSGFGGIASFNTQNPAAMTSACSNGQLFSRGIVENGSGNFILAGAATSGSSMECWVYGGFPSSCSSLSTQYTTPGDTHGIGLNNGLAYLADGSDGLQIVNIISTDVQGVPPTGTLSVSAIPSGDVTEGGRVRLLAAVQDDIQIRNVEFRVNGQRVSIDGNYPFEFYWQVPTGLAGQSVTFSATARDTGGNALELGPIERAIVADTQPPTVTITSPANNAAFFKGDDLIVTLAASDNVRIAAFEFQIDGSPVATVRTSLNTWRLPVPDALGPHILTATVTDTAGLVGVSQAISFRVRHQAISRELSVFVGKPPLQYRDAISREVSVFAGKPPLQYKDAISREVSVYVGP